LAFRLVAPLRHPPPAVAIAHEVGFQPSCQTMLAAGCGEPIDNQDQSPITQSADLATVRFAEPVERRLEPEFTPQLARHQHGSPVPCRNRVHLIGSDIARSSRSGIAVQQARQLVEVEMSRQQVPATEIENGAMTRLAVLAKGFDDAHVLMRDTLAAGRANHA
jgi:hypothetical protein